MLKELSFLSMRDINRRGLELPAEFANPLITRFIIHAEELLFHLPHSRHERRGYLRKPPPPILSAAPRISAIYPELIQHLDQQPLDVVASIHGGVGPVVWNGHQPIAYLELDGKRSKTKHHVDHV